MLRRKLFLGIVFVTLALFVYAILEMKGIMISFETLKAARMDIRHALMENPIQGALIYSLLYIVAIALSLPVATALTVFSGFLFGSFWGTVVVVISATIGATIIFILARFFFRDFFVQKFGARLAPVEREMQDHGLRNIFFLRLMPIVPFALINVAAALTGAKTKDYVLATLFGIAPFTFIYVKAGMRLGELESLRDVVSFQTLIVVSLLVFAVALPIFIKRYRKRARDANAQ